MSVRSFPTCSEAMERASEADRAWFEQHPLRQHRVRPAIAGELPEMPPLSTGWRWIGVRQIQPGVRVRICFTSDRIPIDSEDRAKELFRRAMGAP